MRLMADQLDSDNYQESMIRNACWYNFVESGPWYYGSVLARSPVQLFVSCILKSISPISSYLICLTSQVQVWKVVLCPMGLMADLLDSNNFEESMIRNDPW